jgi:hypothetical protein
VDAVRREGGLYGFRALMCVKIYFSCLGGMCLGHNYRRIVLMGVICRVGTVDYSASGEC